jgi:hypothetical protein
VPVTECWMVLGGIPAESSSGEAAICFRYQWLDDGRAERRRGRHEARPSRLCHTPERKTGLDARNHCVSGAEPTIGPDLSERVVQVRAALPDADRAWFERDLDQAVDIGRSTRDLGRSAMSWRAGGGWCSLASTVAGGGRRPRRGCAAVLRPSGRVSRWTWRTRSAAI